MKEKLTLSVVYSDKTFKRFLEPRNYWPLFRPNMCMNLCENLRLSPSILGIILTTQDGIAWRWERHSNVDK